MSANVRQRVFDAMAQRRGEFADPETWSQRCAGVGVESARAVVKWMCQTGMATKQRKGRAFLYALNADAKRPIDGRTTQPEDENAAATA